MQRNGVNVKKLILDILPSVMLVLLIVIDQVTKTYVLHLDENTNWEKTIVIPGFFEFDFIFNTGAAFGFLQNVSWGQLFFNILTAVALVLFVAYYVYACKKGYKWAKFSIVIIIAGTLGNFIDRLYYGKVVDFIALIFGDYHFPIFNIADACMTIGIIMLVIHFLFLDNNAIFKKSDKNG